MQKRKKLLAVIASIMLLGFFLYFTSQKKTLDIPIPFLSDDGLSLVLRASSVQIGQKVSGQVRIPIYSVDFIDNPEQLLEENKIYIVSTPADIEPMAIDEFISSRLLPGNAVNYYGYEYIKPVGGNADGTTERNLKFTANPFIVRYPGVFFASAKALSEDPAHGGGLQNMTLPETGGVGGGNGITWRPTHAAAPNEITLKPSTLYIFIVNENGGANISKSTDIHVHIKAVTTNTDPSILSGNGSASNPYGVFEDPSNTVSEFDLLMWNLLNNDSSPKYVLRTRLPDTKVVIHLKNGVYLTAGHSEDNVCASNCPIQWSLRSNQSIVGESRDGTIIRLDAQFFTETNKTRLSGIFVIRGDGYKWVNGLRAVPSAQGIKNLTIDANYSTLVEKFNTAPFTNPNPANRTRVHGVQLFGEGNFADGVRVKDVGFYGNVRSEVFGVLLYLSSPNVADPAVRYNNLCTGSPDDQRCSRIVNSIYEESHLHASLRGTQRTRNQTTVFNITGSWNSDIANAEPNTVNRRDIFINGSVIANNIVRLTDSHGEDNNFQGFTVYLTYGGKVFNNRTENAAHGYWSDWWQTHNLEIYNNHFLGANVGVSIVTDVLPNFKNTGYNIHHNEITIIPVNEGARAGIRVHRNTFDQNDNAYYPPSPYARELKNFRIADNTIRFTADPVGAFENAGILIMEMDGLEILNNIIDSRLNNVSNPLPEKYRYFYTPEITAGGTKYRNTKVSISGNTNTAGANIDCIAPDAEIDFLDQNARRTQCPLVFWVDTLSATPNTYAGVGSCTQANPCDASTPEKFRDLMRAIPENSTINFAAGTYDTYGAQDLDMMGVTTKSWWTKTGWKMRGAGIDQTILRLVGLTLDGDAGYVVASRFIPGQVLNDLSDNFELSGMTLDLNTQNQPNQVKGVAGDNRGIVTFGTFVKGNNVVLSNFRVKNLGTNNVNREAFGVVADAAHPQYGDTTNYTVENCVVDSVQPSVREMTLISVSGTWNWLDASGNVVNPTGRGAGMIINPIVRNCTVDGAGGMRIGDGYNSGRTQGIIVWSARNGITENNTFRNLTVGVFMDSWRSENVTIRNNTFIDVASGLFLNLGGANPAQFARGETVNFINNTVQLATDYRWQPTQSYYHSEHSYLCGACVWLAPGTPSGNNSVVVDNFAATGNTFSLKPGIDPQASILGFDLRGVRNANINNNQFNFPVPPTNHRTLNTITATLGSWDASPVIPSANNTCVGNRDINGQTVLCATGRCGDSYLDANEECDEGPTGGANCDRFCHLKQAVPF